MSVYIIALKNRCSERSHYSRAFLLAPILFIAEYPPDFFFFSPLHSLSPSLPTAADSSSARLISSHYIAPPQGSTTNHCENE
ncbi:hypothetical protein CEXT_640791 [Caerostris extrusa]|uniref:Uncharacterized protein n=1 Tax=Caerostris extrusa TaxID=172846 RepID=A0AAV4MUY6_CAEEX|nr:hypothetical protein CEXT_640791 [Caerostris extrusa]